MTYYIDIQYWPADNCDPYRWHWQVSDGDEVLDDGRAATKDAAEIHAMKRLILELGATVQVTIHE